MTDVAARLSQALADRYTIERELGAGGMATVYLAHDRKHDRKVAIKVLRPELAAVIGAERFLAEIRTTANLQHPHILPLFDSGRTGGMVDGQTDDFLFYVMPFIEGESLRDRLNREKQLPITDAVRIATEVAGALDYAHRHQVVHRDIKPENILLHDGRALLADFGIALAASKAGGTRMTETGMSLGTPTYMSPEQAMGEREITPRSDVFALGCVLYEMLLGEPPFTGVTAQAIVAKVLTTEAASVASLRRTVPPAVDQAVHRALQRIPADRFPTAAAFADALTASGAPATASPATLARRFAVPAVGAVLVVSITAFVALRSRAPSGRDTTAPNLRTIAVLPFRNISQDTSQRYFSAGMTEEIATQLSRVAALKVLGRTVTAQYDGKSDRLREMATDLGVGSVVEGSVRLAGNQVRIGVELTDVRSGQTLWSEQYDRQIDDVFAVQGDVARKVSSALQATLTPVESDRVGHAPTRNMAAYQLYLHALDERPFLRAGNAARTALLRQAIQLDTGFALAYATLARTYMFRGVAGEPAWIDSGFVAARKALALDSTEAEAWFALGDLLVQPEKYSEARRAYLKALELRPGHDGAMADLANLYLALGRYDEALDWALQAQQRAPNQPHSWYHVGLPMLALADEPATERYLLKGNRELPGQPRIQGLLIWLELRQRKGQAATQRAKDLVRNNPDNTEVPPIRAELAVALGDPDASELLEPLARRDPEAAGQMLTESLQAMLGLVRRRQGNDREARVLWAAAAKADERMLAEGNEGYAPRMELAAIRAVEGQSREALDWLERGYRAGFKDYVILELDPFFESLRKEERYQAMVRLMKQDVVEMRARAAAAHPALFNSARPNRS